MSSLISFAEFSQVTGDIQHNTELIVNTTGCNEFSIIFECLSEQDEPLNFPTDTKYQLYVSSNGWDTQYDPYDFEHIMLGKDQEKWIHVRDVPLGTSDRCTNSFTWKNMGNYLNPLHFKYVKFVCPEIESAKVRITSSAR